MAPLEHSHIPSTQFLKSGDFAQLCRTTKDTLRHYRQIGLLEPASVTESGYALYSPLQVADFLLVVALQKAGCSLETIKAYLDDPREDGLDSILESHIETLKEQRRALLAHQRFLEGTLNRRRSIGSWASCKEGWRVAELAERLFADVEISELFSGEAADPNMGRELAGDLIGQGLAYLAEGITHEMQSSYRVGLDALKRGIPDEDFHVCIALSAARHRKADHVRPKGLYFQRLRSISVDTVIADKKSLFNAYNEFYDEAVRRGFTPIGDLYEQEISLYTGDTSAHVHTELSIQIAEPARDSTT